MAVYEEEILELLQLYQGIEVETTVQGDLYPEGYNKY